MSDDCTTNPDFCGFNRVHMPYCDGNSFSGDRTDPGMSVYDLEVFDVKFLFRTTPTAYQRQSTSLFCSCNLKVRSMVFL